MASKRPKFSKNQYLLVKPNGRLSHKRFPPKKKDIAEEKLTNQRPA